MESRKKNKQTIPDIPKEAGSVKRSVPGRRIWFCALTGGLFIGFTGQWGRQLEEAGNVNFTALSSYLVPLFAAAAVTPLLAWGFAWLGKDHPKRRSCGRAEKKNRFLLTALLLFLSWFFVFLAVYPGFFAYDASDELSQVLTASYVTRHPLLHVLLLGKTVSGVERLTGSYNTGIAVYVLFQMAAMALLVSWELACFQKLGAGRILHGIGFCFFAFFPVIPMYVLCTSKDIWYTAGMLAVITLLCLKGKEQEGAKAGRLPWVGLGAALFVMAVFRNNGFYVFLVMIPVLLWFAGKRDRKKMAVTAGAVLVLVLGQNAVLNAALKPVDTGVQETLTVPIQQLARTWNYSPEVFSEEDREALFEILPQEVLERYTPKLSDLVKIDFCTENYEKDPGRYLALWLRTGLKAPFTYLNAWLMTSYGFWYPDASIDVYNGWRNYVKSSWFSFETEEPGVRQSRFPWLEEQYRRLSLENIVQELPVISWLFSPGFLCRVFVLAGLFLASCGRRKQLAAFMPVFLNWLTVLLGPTYLVRYVLIFWFALPLLLVVINSQMCYTSKDNGKG